MFTNQRYTTYGVQLAIQIPIQDMLWSMIDDLQKAIKLDYLQIFVLKDNKIIHSQENPKYKAIAESPFYFSQSIKIYVIDNGSYSTMLLAKEY